MSFCSRNPGLYDRVFRFSQACQKVFFFAFFGDTKISDKILYLFFSDSRQDLCIGGVSTFFRHSDSNTLENSKKVAAQKTGKTALFPLGNRT